MNQYRKLPVEVEAMQFNNDETTFDLLHWANASRTGLPFVRWINDRLEVPTFEGTMTANVGDWIIRGVAGELYPCKPDIFAATYEQVAS
jgi:hypothetical protein